MGQLQAKAKAEEALRRALDEAIPALSAEQKQSVQEGFMKAFRL